MHDYSKALEKLFDTINTFFGGNYKARAILSEGKAKAEVTELQAQADAKATLIKGNAEIELYKKILDVQAQRMIKQQSNMDNIIMLAEAEIKTTVVEGSTISQEEVDEDWINRFFEHAQSFSSEQMQRIWAKILAGEVVKPGSFSKRTLDIVRNMSQQEAQSFNALLPYICRYNDLYYIVRTNGEVYGNIARCDEAGLLNGSVLLHFIEIASGCYIQIGTKVALLSLREGSAPIKLTLNIYKLTTAGAQLYEMQSKREPYAPYLNDILQTASKANLVVSFGDVEGVRGTELLIKNRKPFTPN